MTQPFDFIKAHQDKIRSLDKNTLVFIQEELKESIDILVVFQKDQQRQNNSDEILMLEGEIRAKRQIIKVIQIWLDGFT